MEREKFTFHKDWKVSLDSLSAQHQLELYNAIVDYGINGIESAHTDVVKVAMTFVRTQIDKDNHRYENYIQRQRENGSLGGRPKKDKSVEPIIIEQKENLPKETIDLDKFVAYWNDVVNGSIIPKIRTISGERKRKLIARMRQYGKHAIYEAMEKVRNSDFLRGNTGWTNFNFDWFVKPNNFAKLIEGNYDNKIKYGTTIEQQSNEAKQRAEHAAARIQQLLKQDDKERFGSESE